MPRNSLSSFVGAVVLPVQLLPDGSSQPCSNLRLLCPCAPYEPQNPSPFGREVHSCQDNQVGSSPWCVLDEHTHELLCKDRVFWECPTGVRRNAREKRLLVEYDSFHVCEAGND